MTKEDIRQYGTLIMGLGMIFFGMAVMSGAMKPLRSYQPFIDLMQVAFREGARHPAALVEDDDRPDARIAQDSRHPLDRVRRQDADALGALVLDDLGDTHGAGPPDADSCGCGSAGPRALIARGERWMVPHARMTIRRRTDALEGAPPYSRNVSRI